MPRSKSIFGANPNKTLNWLLLALALVLVTRKWICMPALVIGNSMTPTLRDGQVVLVNKVAYHLHAPERGDLVSVCTGSGLMIKRIIGLPGEEVALRDGRLYVNGRLMPEPYVELPDHFELASGKIPSNCYGVIGDNRCGTVVAVVGRQRIVGKLMCAGQPTTKDWATVFNPTPLSDKDEQMAVVFTSPKPSRELAGPEHVIFARA